MTIENNTTISENTTIENENKRIWDTKLADVEAWKIARSNLNKWLDENEKETFGKFFESKASKSSPFSQQNVAILAHTSAGYVSDKWKKAKEQALKLALDNKAEYDELSVIEVFVQDVLAPNMAEERAKAEAERIAAEAAAKLRIEKIRQAVNDRLSIFAEYRIPKTEATLTTAYKSVENDENKRAIIGTLAVNILGDKAEAFVKGLGETLEVVELQ
jgi:membrane-associated HD superfamily phosphohydrolase